MPEHKNTHVFRFTKPSHIFQTQPFRLTVKASGYAINYIWRCFSCIYVSGSTISPRRLKQGKWGSKTPCQNDKSILIHAHTCAYTHRHTFPTKRCQYSGSLCGALFPLQHPLSLLPFTAACLTLSPATLLPVSFSLEAGREEPHSPPVMTLLNGQKCFKLMKNTFFIIT